MAAKGALKGPYVLVTHVVHNETWTFIKDLVAVVELTNEAIIEQVLIPIYNHRLLFEVFVRQTRHIHRVVLLMGQASTLHMRSMLAFRKCLSCLVISGFWGIFLVRTRFPVIPTRWLMTTPLCGIMIRVLMMF